MSGEVLGTLFPETHRPWQRWALSAVLLFALAVAAHLRLQASLHTEVSAPLRSDAGQYFSYAYNLKHFTVYSRSKHDGRSQPQPDALRNPGYPLLLMALMDDPPNSATILKITIVQAFLGVGIALMTFIFARAFLPPLYAVVAVLLTAISPHLVNAGVYVLSEVLFSFCVIALLCVLVRRDFLERTGITLAAGMMLGVCTLVRPTTLYLPLVLVLLLYRHWPARLATRGMVIVLLGMALIYGPWLARNMLQLGQFSDHTIQVNTLHHGSYPDFMYQDDPTTYGYPYRYDPRSAVISNSMASVTEEILSNFKAEPARYLKWYLLSKPYQLWSWLDAQGVGMGSFTYPTTKSPYYDSNFFSGTYFIASKLHWPLVMFAGLFCLLVWLPSAKQVLGPNLVMPAQLCAALLIYATAIHIPGAPFSRYSIPFLPEMYISAAGSVFMLLGYAGKWRQREDSLVVAT